MERSFVGVEGSEEKSDFLLKSKYGISEVNSHRYFGGFYPLRPECRCEKHQTNPNGQPLTDSQARVLQRHSVM